MYQNIFVKTTTNEAWVWDDKKGLTHFNFTPYAYKKDPNGNVINNDTDFVKSLLEHSGIAVVQGSAFGLEGFFRISYATSMENLKKALEKIKNFCKELK